LLADKAVCVNNNQNNQNEESGSGNEHSGSDDNQSGNDDTQGGNGARLLRLFKRNDM